MTDQQLAFRAIADFGHRWRLARDARRRRRATLRGGRAAQLAAAIVGIQAHLRGL